MNIILPRACLIFLVAFSLGLVSPLRAGSADDFLNRADAELNSAYQKALVSMRDGESKTKLREAQRAWVAFRDAEIVLHISIPPASGSQIKILQGELAVTRTKQLKDLAEGN